MKALKELVLALLDSKRSAYSLRPELVELTSSLARAQTTAITSQDTIEGGESQTSAGLALSPTMAMMCADDYVRTIKFIRGLHAAIRDLRTQIHGRPVKVLYVGCGPYATLAVPMMAIFSSDEATFTLVDIHSESIESAKSIIDDLGFSGTVSAFEIADANAYRISSLSPPDIILAEMMRACLEWEPQVAVSRHLLRQAPQALLIPEEVCLELSFVDHFLEFNFDSHQNNASNISRDRITLGSVFTLTREAAQSWDASEDRRLTGATVRLPDRIEPRYELMLFTVIRVYASHILKDYDSGLTCPKVISLDGSIKPGDVLQFYYELGPHPQLHAEVVENS